MKAKNLILILPILAQPAIAESGCCPDTVGGNRVFRDAATHETIVGAKDEEKLEDPIAAHKLTEPLKPLDEDKIPKRQSIVDRSEIIHRGPLVTLLPKRSVLHLPSHLKGVKGRVTGKKLVNWEEFHRSNISWIDTVEVTRAMAEGREPLPEELAKSFEKRTKAVVAVYKGAPISVLPVEEPEAAVAETNTINQP